MLMRPAAGAMHRSGGRANAAYTSSVLAVPEGRSSRLPATFAPYSQ